MIGQNLGNQAQPIIETANAAKQVDSAKKIIILLPQNPSIDAVAAALALYLSVKKNKKEVKVGCSNPLTVIFNRLFAVNKVVQEIGNKNSVISFPCSEDSLEKVSYNIDNNIFNLVIERKEGYEPIKPNEMKFSYTGVSGDLVVVIGANKIEDLGRIYQSDTTFFAQTQLINISNSAIGVGFGKTNIFDPNGASLSELTADLIKQANLPLDADLSTNLIAGIESATNNLAYKTSGRTFELMSWLMNAGGQRGHMGMTSPAGAYGQSRIKPFSPSMPGQWQTPPFGASMTQPTGSAFNQLSQAYQTAPVPNNQVNQSGFEPNDDSSLPVKPPTIQPKPIKPPEQFPDGTEPDKEADSAIPKPDWFKPKIFKGKTRV